MGSISPASSAIGDIRVCLNGTCDRVGVPRVRIHALCHTFGLTMAMEGAAPFSNQKAMGHKDIKTTMIYVPQMTISWRKTEKRTRKEPDSLSDSSWCRRRDSPESASAVHATCFAASCSQMPRNFHWVASAKCRAARLRADALLKSRFSSCPSAPSPVRVPAEHQPK
jgi:hypothetical protein